MDLRRILFVLSTISVVESSFKLRENITVKCNIEQSLLNSDYNLRLGLSSGSANTTYTVSYCKCKGQPSKCMKLNACNWKNVSCKWQAPDRKDRCSSFVISPVSFWSYGDKCIVRIYDRSDQDKTFINQFVMERNFFLRHCFLSHRPELYFHEGDMQYSVDISWNFQPHDKSLTLGSPGVLTLFSYNTGKQLSVVGCKSERPCFGYRNPCKCSVQDLLPCQKYRICVRTNIFDGRGLDESKIKTCKNYTVPHGVIPRIGTIEMRKDAVKGVTRFSWLDSSNPNSSTWFYETLFTFDGKNSSFMTNKTEKTVLELKVPAGTEKCTFSVAKCVSCKCGRTVEKHFKNCAVYGGEPKLAETRGPENSGNKTQSAFIIGYVCVGLLIVVLIGVLSIFIRRYLQPQQQSRDSQPLPVLDEILPRGENLGYSNTDADGPYDSWPAS